MIQGTRRGTHILASHYPYAGDTHDTARHTAHRPVDHGIPLLHGHTHDRDKGPVGHQFHVGIDAFGSAPLPFTLVDAWLDDVRREDKAIAAIGRERPAAGQSARRSQSWPRSSGSTSTRRAPTSGVVKSEETLTSPDFSSSASRSDSR